MKISSLRITLDESLGFFLQVILLRVFYVGGSCRDVEFLFCYQYLRWNSRIGTRNSKSKVKKCNNIEVVCLEFFMLSY